MEITFPVFFVFFWLGVTSAKNGASYLHCESKHQSGYACLRKIKKMT